MPALEGNNEASSLTHLFHYNTFFFGFSLARSNFALKVKNKKGLLHFFSSFE
jgi:hypothetical protein